MKSKAHYPKTEIIKAVALLEKLESVPQRTRKEALLGKYRTNEVLRKMLSMTLGNDKYFIHINVNPTKCTALTPPRKAWLKFLKLCEQLSSRDTLKGNAAKGKVTEFLLSVDPLLCKWFLRILNHNLRIGVSQKIVDTVFGTNFLNANATSGASNFVFRGCMLAKPRDKLPKRDAILQFPLAGEYKLDGERFLGFVFPKMHLVEIVSRGNLRKPEIEGCKNFIDQLLVFARRMSPSGEPVFLDGEFLSSTWNRLSSIIGSTKNFKPDLFLREVRAVLFDWAPLAAYETGRFDAPWQERKHLLLGTIDELNIKNLGPEPQKFSHNVYVLGHVILNSEKELKRFYDQALDVNFEGVLTKKLDGLEIFNDHRSALVVKHKPEEAATGTIVACRPGKGNNAEVNLMVLKKAIAILKRFGTIHNDGYYLRVTVLNSKKRAELVSALSKATQDSQDRRVCEVDKEVTYRYSERLGYFVVKVDKTTFKVGSGFKYKGGNDQRMELWQRRKELVGTKVDFKYQADPQEVAKARFNRFVRLREDL
jgi:ATP-dependent DNA ligase